MKCTWKVFNFKIYCETNLRLNSLVETPNHQILSFTTVKIIALPELFSTNSIETDRQKFFKEFRFLNYRYHFECGLLDCHVHFNSVRF